MLYRNPEFRWLCIWCIVVLMFIGMSGHVQANGCHTYTGDDINGYTVPVDTTDYCGATARITYECGRVTVQANNTDTYYILEQWTGQGRVIQLEDGATYTYAPAPATERVELWSTYGFEGLVNTTGTCDVSDTVTVGARPDDDRLNWELGDHYAKVYLVADHVQVYEVGTGEGVLTLNVDSRVEGTYCNDNLSVCVYVFETYVQVNITDDEGKSYEIFVQTS